MKGADRQINQSRQPHVGWCRSSLLYAMRTGVRTRRTRLSTQARSRHTRMGARRWSISIRSTRTRIRCRGSCKKAAFGFLSSFYGYRSGYRKIPPFEKSGRYKGLKAFWISGPGSHKFQVLRCKAKRTNEHKFTRATLGTTSFVARESIDYKVEACAEPRRPRPILSEVTVGTVPEAQSSAMPLHFDLGADRVS